MSEGRILVIDDSEFVLAKVKALLSEAGYEVQTTTQTVGAARYLRSCDLVMVDFHMPGIDGAAVLDSLKSAALTASNSCCFYLYTSDDEVASRYAVLGFDGAITHKGDGSALLTQIRAAFRRRRMREIARRGKETNVSGGPESKHPSVPAPPLHFEAGGPHLKASLFAPPLPHDLSSTSKVSPSPVPPPRRTVMPPPRSRTDQDEDEELTADFPRTPT